MFWAEAVATDNLADGLDGDGAGGESVDILTEEAGFCGDVDRLSGRPVIPGKAWPLGRVALEGRRGLPAKPAAA